MKKFLLAMFIFTLTYHIGFSQITFVKEYAIPGALSNGVSIVEDIAGGYIFTGFSYDSLSDQTYQYVAKCDPVGSINWVKYYDTLIYDGSMKRFANGDLLVVGGQSIMRLDNSGNVIWAKHVNGISLLFVDAFTTTLDGGIIASGYNLVQPDFSFELFKMDSIGNLVWSMQTPVSSNHINFSRVIETSDGGYLALYSEENQNQDWRIIVIKADSSGNILWSKSFDGAGYHPVPDLLQCKDGNFVFARYTSFAATLSKIDSIGGLMWSKSYLIDGIRFTTILEKANDNLVMSGSISDTVDQRMLFMETDVNGNFIKANVFNATYYGDAADIAATSDSGYIALCNDGRIDPSIPGSFNFVELIKMDSMFQSACNFQPINLTSTNQSLPLDTGALLIPGSISVNSIAINFLPSSMNTSVECKSINIDDLNIDDLIELYPNPAASKLNIEIASGLIQEIVIYDLTGNLFRKFLLILHSLKLISQI
ncbi:MAG: hypothetical protein IPP27_03995 [Bacteroidetes bacterium]|nr:hypothetical protein [Bacteroidota bacterium]